MSTHERRIVTAIVAVLLGTAIWFRLLRLASVPGLSGDEGWWGVQALAWLAGRPYEPRTTSGNPIDLFFLVPVALLPTAIAHSRICQDPSQSVFWSGLVVYLALLGVKERDAAGRWLAAAIVLFPVALWTHPTNVFVAPFLLLPIVAPLAARMPASRRARIGVAVATAAALAAGLIVAWLAFGIAPRAYPSLDKPWLALAAGRLVDAGQWLEFAVNTVR